MKKHIYYIITVIATLLVANSTHGQTNISGSWSGGSLSGSYKLTDNTKLTTKISVANNKTLTIDLNGMVLYGEGISELIFVDKGGTLIIKDSNPDQGHAGYIDSKGLFRWPQGNNTQFTVKGGIIYNPYKDNNTDRKGISVSGTCIIEHAKIMGCYANEIGSAVTVTSTGSFTMKAGEISYNYSVGSDAGARAGVVYGEPCHDNQGGLIDISNTIISNNKSTGDGGAICGFGVNLTNCTIENNSTSTEGGAIYVRDDGASDKIGYLNISNCTIQNNSAANGGGLYSTVTTTILSSRILHNYATTTGGGLYCTGQTTIKDSKIQGNRAMSTETGAKEDGGGIVNKGRGGGFNFAGASATTNENDAITFILDNTDVSENACMYYGGGGQLQSNGKLIIRNNTKINSNTCVLKGAAGLHLTGGVFFYMNESTEISNNIALGGVGGGIHSSYECFIHLDGGEIVGNKVYGRGGGVHVNTGGDLVLNGTDIRNNYAYDGINLTSSTVAKGDDGKYSWSDPVGAVDEWSPGYGGGILINSGSCTMNKGNLSENYAQTLGGGLALVMAENSGQYADQVRLTTFTLNSGTVNKNRTDGNGGGVYLMENILRNLTDAEKAKYTQLVGGDWTPKIILNGGIFSENSAAGLGGGAYQEQKTEFIVSDSKTTSITGNKAGISGGAVYIAKGQFTVNGTATITGNVATSGSGGAVYLGKGDNANPSVFTVGQNGKLNLGGNNATLGNTAGLNGGGIYCQGAFTVNGTASVQYNNAANGGGVYVDGANAIFTKATSLLNNTSTGNGGAVYVDGGNITLKANTISSNSAANGGAVYLNNGSFSADGNTTMSSNSASGNGGSVYVNGGGIAITGSSSVLTLSGNSANNGGAFYVTGGNITANTISKATISNNYSAASGGAGGEGGAFYVSNGNINMCKTDLSGNGKNGSNITTTNGGAIALYNGVFQFADGSEIKNNAATGNGGGLYVSSSTAQSITCIGGSYLANSSTLGGGIYASGPINLTIAANVRNNTATNGGGLYLTGDVKMTFGYEDSNGVVDGLIVDNTAYGPDGSTDGVGGGIYLDKGTLSFYLPSDKAKQKLGIYNNAASYEAADIYSSGNGTTIVLPNVGDMNLTDFDVPGSTLYWVRDFYDNRYQTALMNLNADIEAMILDFDDATTLTLEDKQCLDLGYDLVYVTITPVNLSESDNAVLVISYPSDRENPNSSSVSQYRKVTLQGGMNAVVGLPSGKWHFDMTEWAAKYRFQEFNPTHVDGFIDITRDALKGTDGVITVTFTVEETKKDIIKYDFIKVNRMVPKVSN